LALDEGRPTNEEDQQAGVEEDNRPLTVDPTPTMEPNSALRTPHSAFQIVSMLGGYRRRVRGTRRRRYLAMSTLGIGATWLMAALAYYFDLQVPGALPIAIALTLLLPVAAFAIEAARTPSLSDTAALIDRRLDDNQRLLTSVELMSKGEGLTSPLTESQIKTSAMILTRAEPKSVYPSRTPWNLATAGLGLLLLALGLFTLKGGGFSPLGVGILPHDEPVEAFLAPRTPDTGLPPSELTPEPTPTSEPKELVLGGNQQQQEGEATTTPDPNQPANPEEQAAASQQAESDLARLGRALDGQSVTQQASDALKQGNTDEAAQELTELGKENDQVSKAAKEGLADALEQAAQDTDANRDLRKAEQEAAKALRDGDYKQVDAAMQKLAEAMQQTAANIVPQQELAKGFPEEPTSGQQDASQQPGDQSEQGDTGAGQQDGQQESEAGDKSGQEGPEGGGDTGQQGEGESQQDGQGGGNKSESGEGDGQSGAPGQGTRVNGPKDPTDLDVPGNPFELEAQPEPGNTQPQPDQQQDRPGLTLDGGSGGSGAAPVAPGDAVNVPGETGSLPLDRWDIIRKFFTPSP
jgi:hypothetical protein